MSRCTAQTWIGVFLVGLLAIGAAGSSGAVTPAPELQVGKVPVCKVTKNGKERTKLVASHRVQKKLEGKYKLGECPDPANGRVMCGDIIACPERPEMALEVAATVKTATAPIVLRVNLNPGACGFGG